MSWRFGGSPRLHGWLHVAASRGGVMGVRLCQARPAWGLHQGRFVRRLDTDHGRRFGSQDYSVASICLKDSVIVLFYSVHSPILSSTIHSSIL